MPVVQWNQGADARGMSEWWTLCFVDLSSIGPFESGVYIIWIDTDPQQTLLVGKGGLSEKIREHRDDLNIIANENHGTLCVTWTELPESYQAGVEAFLFDSLNPLRGKRDSSAASIKVNLPTWGKDPDSLF